MTEVDRWIHLDGAVNVRDLGGLPTVDGRVTVPGRLIRSDNLQGLSDRDVTFLVDELGVRSVADLRAGVEVAAEGSGPLTSRPEVVIRNLSLFPESGERPDVASGAPVLLPWHDRTEEAEGERRGATGVYLRYLEERADSVVEALRMIATSPGATIVHCAAGKDRTGTVIALALSEVGVERQAIVDDYAASAEVIREIFDRLRASDTYAATIGGDEDADRHAPRSSTIERVLAAIDDEYGGVPAWLREHGWTADDASALRATLLG